MSVPKPHFLLYSGVDREKNRGTWRFALHAADGSAKLEARDHEPEAHGERLELLAVVRGLEALEQPSHVTLWTSSRYVRRGLAYGIEEWRRNDWTWESFGEMVPVKNGDLWRRLDRALRFHRLDVRHDRSRTERLTIEAAPSRSLRNQAETEQPACREQPSRSPVRRQTPPRRRFYRARLRVTRRLARCRTGWWLSLAQLGTSLLPRPWLG